MHTSMDNRAYDAVTSMIQRGLGLDIDCSLAAVKGYKLLEQELILASSYHTDKPTPDSLLAFRQVLGLLSKNPSLQGSSEKLREAEATDRKSVV